ncbi:MAG: hypothetical protein QME12_03380 [Nanoarchaeota archaeon]|nr:hypothetical protein [Nanoarchaeota archaeon]
MRLGAGEMKMTLLTKVRQGNELCNEVIRLLEFGRFYVAHIGGNKYYTFTPFQAAVLLKFGAKLEFYETDRPYYNTYPASRVRLKQVKGIEALADEAKVEKFVSIVGQDLREDKRQ